MPANAWIAYTDGACSGNPGPAGSGVVLVAPGGKMHEGFEYLGEATNNVAELTAILRAVEWIRRPTRSPSWSTPTASTRSACCTKGWKAKANGELVAPREDARRGSAARASSTCPGHAGVPLNERADELAREAVSSRSTRAPKVA